MCEDWLVNLPLLKKKKNTWFDYQTWLCGTTNCTVIFQLAFFFVAATFLNFGKYLPNGNI